MAETETEDRTQAPSNHRRQEARERGQAASSPELSGAAGLLAASAVLSVWGEPLASSLLAVVREPLTGVIPVSADAAEVVARLRSLAEQARLDPAFAEKFLAFIIQEVIRHHEAIARN